MIFRHKKGGIYLRLFKTALHTETGELLTVYIHLWPHCWGVYCRPTDMFNELDRFKRISVMEEVKKLRGFAAMTPERRREIASIGGRNVPDAKRSFSTNNELAKSAGKIGGSVGREKS